MKKSLPHLKFFFLLLCLSLSLPSFSISYDTLIIQRINKLSFISIIQTDSISDQYEKEATDALTLAKKIHYWQGEVTANYKLGWALQNQQNYFNALEHYIEASNIAKAHGDHNLYGLVNKKIGDMFLDLPKYDLSQKYYAIAWKNLDWPHNEEYAYLIHRSTGILATKTGDYKSAYRHFYLALQSSMKLKNDLYIGPIYKYIGIAFLSENKYLKAIYYFKVSVKYGLAAENLNELGSLYTLIAHSYETLHDDSNATYYNHLAKEIRKKAGFSEHYISSLINLGDLHLRLNHLDSASFYIQSALSLLSTHNDLGFKEYGYLKLSELKQKQHDYKGAFQAFQKYSVIHDSLLFEKNRADIGLLEASHRIYLLEQENEIMSAQLNLKKAEIKIHKKTQLIYLSLTVFTLAFVVLLLVLYIRTKRSRATFKLLNIHLHQEIVVRMQAEEKLRTSEASYRFLAENTLDLIIHMDANLNVLYISPNCEGFLGYAPTDFKTGFYPYLFIHPEYQEMMKEQYLDMKHKLQPNLICYEAVRKDGSKFWVESLSNPIIDQTTSMFAGSLTVIRNIEERVKYEEQLFENTRQKEILLREIHHRVKNNFALLFSILTLQRYSTKNSEMKELIEELQVRIRAMSSIHDLLYRNDDLADIPFDIYAVQLVNIVVAAFRNKPIHVHHNMDTCILDIKIALPLGLIVNELVTNSFKYAFKENGEGILSLGLHLYEPGTEQSPEKWKLTVRDNGKGLPEEYAAKTSHTLGTQIITMLVVQIEGEIKATSDEGACFEIIFPQQID